MLETECRGFFLFSLFCFLFFLEVVAQRPKCSGSLLRRQSSWLNNWIYNNTITKNREKMNMKSDEISNHYRNLMEHILNTYICKDAFFLFFGVFFNIQKDQLGFYERKPQSLSFDLFSLRFLSACRTDSSTCGAFLQLGVQFRLAVMRRAEMNPARSAQCEGAEFI